MIRNQRGITLLSLVITIILIMILVSVGVNYGQSSILEIKLQNFSNQLQQIQTSVDSTHEKMKMLDNPTYIFVNKQTMGSDIKTNSEAMATLKKLTGIDYGDNSISLDDADYYTPQHETLYRYLSKRDLERQLDIKNAKQDVIINFKTREVISVKGQVYNGEIFYRLDQLKKKG